MNRLSLALLLGVTAATAACGDRDERAEMPEKAPVRYAPAAGSQMMAVQVTGLVPGIDTSLVSLRNPYHADDAAIADGERYFNAFNCSGCHAPLGGGGMGPPLSDTVWIYGGDPDNVYLSIVQGRPNGMPAWQHLPPDVVWKITAYIHTLPKRKSRVGGE